MQSAPSAAALAGAHRGARQCCLPERPSLRPAIMVCYPRSAAAAGATGTTSVPPQAARRPRPRLCHSTFSGLLKDSRSPTLRSSRPDSSDRPQAPPPPQGRSRRGDRRSRSHDNRCLGPGFCVPRSSQSSGCWPPGKVLSPILVYPGNVADRPLNPLANAAELSGPGA